PSRAAVPGRPLRDRPRSWRSGSLVVAGGSREAQVSHDEAQGAGMPPLPFSSGVVVGVEVVVGAVVVVVGSVVSVVVDSVVVGAVVVVVDAVVSELLGRVVTDSELE